MGETGGKGYILAHSSADPVALITALIRGAFEYGGQKCSAPSRAYIPRSVWSRMSDELTASTDELPMGDPTDFSNFLGALIDDRAFGRLARTIERVRVADHLRIVAGGTYDDSVGYFVRPTVVLSDDPTDEIFTKEYFGPFLGVHVFDDVDFDRVVRGIDEHSVYGP